MSAGRGLAAVTGASRGIGRAAAWRLARRGYRVFALARSLSDLEELTTEGRNAGLEIVPIEMDITRARSREHAVEAIMTETNGYGLDVLVSNAGYAEMGAVEEVTPDRLQRQFEVNVIGLIAFAQPFLPPMRNRARGRLINISSAAGRVSTPFMGVYSASKFALEALSDALRVELAPFGPRVILIEPGPIATDFWKASVWSDAESPSPYAALQAGWAGTRDGAGLKLFERTADDVAKVIVRAAESRHPRPRYTITLSAKGATIGRRLVPDVLMDLLFRIGMRGARQ